MGEIVKFGRKTEEEKYDEALAEQYRAFQEPEKDDPNQSVAFIIDRAKADIAKRIEEICKELGVAFGWEGEYNLSKEFLPLELTTVQIALNLPDVSIRKPRIKELFHEAITIADWMSIGADDEGGIFIVFYVENVVKFKRVKK